MGKIHSEEPGSVSALYQAFDRRPPAKITQAAYEGNPNHLSRLARLRAGDQPEVRDLWEYTQDLLYTEIDGALLGHLLPFCLEAWRTDLRGASSDLGGFVEQFYPVLANREVLSRHLTPAQTSAVSSFMRASILEEIDDQPGLFYIGSSARPYHWVTALTTHGVLLPDVSHLWIKWWAAETVGRAVAVVQYVSCLMYPDKENPVFAPWTPTGGGGPPCLWEYGGHLYAHRWLEENVRFLRGYLSTNEVIAALGRAFVRLVGQPEHEVATKIQKDIPFCSDILTVRCAALPCLLATAQKAGTLLEWPA